MTPGSRLPTLETLEERATPAAYTSNGDLYVLGTSGSDTIEISQTGGSRWELPGYRVTLNGQSSSFSTFSVRGRIYVYGYAGDDTIANRTSYLPMTAFGRSGDDTLIGGAVGDSLWGGAGNDTLIGNGGDDLLVASSNDSWDVDNWNNVNRLYGGTGNDTLYGHYGTNFLYGESGVDHLYGGFDNDFMYGGSEWDYLDGRSGNDWLDGGQDGYADTLIGGPGQDYFVEDAVRYVSTWYDSSGQQQWYIGWYNRDRPVDAGMGDIVVSR